MYYDPFTNLSVGYGEPSETVKHREEYFTRAPRKPAARRKETAANSERASLIRASLLTRVSRFVPLI